MNSLEVLRAEQSRRRQNDHADPGKNEGIPAQYYFAGWRREMVELPRGVERLKAEIARSVAAEVAADGTLDLRDERVLRRSDVRGAHRPGFIDAA